MHSARPSSRSSIRSTGSIGSYGNRRASSGGLAGGGGGAGGAGGGGGGVNSGGSGGGGGSKGILVSTSRTGAARSAAILLISCHITAVSKQNSRASSRHTSGAGCSQHSRDNLDDNNGTGSGVCGGGGGGGGGGSGSGGGCRSCESTISMNRQLQRQLNHQRHLLSFELSPAKSKNQDRFRTLLGMNGIDNNYHDEHDRDNDHDFDNDAYHSIDPLATVHHHDGSGSSGGAGALPGGYYDSTTAGYGAGAELHHLHIGALPTPASETPRFAVNQLSHQSSKSSVINQTSHTHNSSRCMFPVSQFCCI